jgi:uncharacterized protein
MACNRLNPRVVLWLSLLLLTLQIQAEDTKPSMAFESDVMIPMRDGVRLAANIFRPTTEGRFPVILMRSPYGKPDEKWGDAKRYLPAGYAMVVQDCRGRGKSEGVWDPFRYDVEDGFDTQEWVGKQPWCNGDIGTAGGSYVGWTQWGPAPNASRHLKAMVPVVPFGDAYDLAYAGGAFQLALLMGWGAAVGGVNLSPEKLTTAYLHLPLSTLGDQFEKKVSYIDDWIHHPEYDDYWKQRGMNYDFADVTVPALNIGGWYDIFSQTTIDLVNNVRGKSRDRAVRRNQFVVMGPWTHGVGARKVGELDFGAGAQLDIGDYQFKWFEFWLKGRETGIQDWPALYLYVMGRNQWRPESEWPLKRTLFTSFYLRGAGHANTAKGDGLLSTATPADEPPDRFTYEPTNPVPSVGGNNLVGATAGPYDQAKVEAREDVLVYSTPPLEKDTEVTGPVKLILWAASDAPDTDFTGKLVDAYPDGKAYNLCEGILRARTRLGRQKAPLLRAGQAEKFEIDLWVTSNVFLSGHRIRVEVSSSNFPRFDRNPNTGHEFGADAEMVTAHQTILHDAEHSSHLLLPVIPSEAR